MDSTPTSNLKNIKSRRFNCEGFFDYDGESYLFKLLIEESLLVSRDNSLFKETRKINSSPIILVPLYYNLLHVLEV